MSIDLGNETATYRPAPCAASGQAMPAGENLPPLPNRVPWARSIAIDAGRNGLMEWLVWGGATVSFVGLCGLVLSIVRVARARKAGLSDEELRAAVQKVMPLNLGSLFLSVIGLMLVILGIFLA